MTKREVIEAAHNNARICASSIHRHEKSIETIKNSLYGYKNQLAMIADEIESIECLKSALGVWESAAVMIEHITSLE